MPLHTISVDVGKAGLTAFPVLRGLRTRLRAPAPADAAALFALYSDAATMRWWPRAPMRTQDEASAWLEECAGHLARGDRIDWIVAGRRSDAALGTCTLFDIERRAGRAAVGYALLPEHRGRGHAGDAVALAMAWAARALGVRRFEATVDPRNVASQRVLARTGFIPGSTEDHWVADVST